MQVGIGGKDLYLAINDKKSEEAVRSAREPQGLEPLRPGPRHGRSGSYSGRDWNVATNMVITARLPARSWATGRRANSLSPSRLPARTTIAFPGLGFNALLDTGGDSFYFPKNSNPEVTKAQLELASMLLSKEDAGQVQPGQGFAAGARRRRSDGCQCLHEEGPRNPVATSDNVLPSTEQMLDSDTQGQLQRPRARVLLLQDVRR